MISTVSVFNFRLFLAIIAIVQCQTIPNSTSESQLANADTNHTDFATPVYKFPCNRNDPAIEKCILEGLNSLKPSLIRGIPELKIPPIHPLTISELRVERDLGTTGVSAIFSKIIASEFVHYEVNKINADISSLEADVHLKIPMLNLAGSYEVTTNVSADEKSNYAMEYRGYFQATLEDIEAINRVQGAEEIRNGVRHMRINRLRTDFDFVCVNIHISDQIYGEGIISRLLNDYLHENAKKIIESMKPAVCPGIEKIFVSFLNSALAKIPLEAYLRET